MSGRRATEAERGYWKEVGEAARLAEADAPQVASLQEVFERMNAIRQRLGRFSEAGLPADDDRAIEENLELRERFLRKKPRGA
jgi:hypothetical protein